ncbi:MAG TPA: hypothetical protein VIG80_03150 [Bacillaceae bacterium]
MPADIGAAIPIYHHHHSGFYAGAVYYTPLGALSNHLATFHSISLQQFVFSTIIKHGER